MSEFPGGDYDEWKCSEPDDDERRPYRLLGYPIPHPTGCRCCACAGAAQP